MSDDLQGSKPPAVQAGEREGARIGAAPRRRLVLGSSSPRRLEILRSLGIEPLIRPAFMDETPLEGEPPRVLVVRLALEKALAAVSASASEPFGPETVVLGADTSVVIAGEVLGKPPLPADASRMLERLSGRTHEVLTGLALCAYPFSGGVSGVCVTRVRFRPLGPETIARYVATGEPFDKAGAYGIQGEGRHLVESIDGSYSNVVGLPVELFEELLGRLGLRVADLARTET